MAFVKFPDTVWTRIRRAASGKTTAENQFVMSYYEPVKNFLLRLGVAKAEAEDITQFVFMKIFEGNLLKVADEKKGRFRSFILAVTKNILANWNKKEHAQKRGGAAKGEELDITKFFVSYENDETFDRIWMEHIVRRSMERLRAECEDRRLPYFRALHEYLNDKNASYESIGKEMNVNAGQIRNYISRGKKKLRAFIEEEIAMYCSTKEEFEEEFAYMWRFLKGAGKS